MIHPVEHLPSWLLLVAGGAIGVFRSWWAALYRMSIGFIITKMSVSARFDQKHHPESYKWTSAWLKTRLSDRHINSLLVRPTISRENKKEFIYIPNYGTYWIRLRSGHLLLASHKENSGATTTIASSDSVNLNEQSLTIKIFPTRSRAILDGIINEARDEYAKSNLVEFYSTRWSYWPPPSHINPRSIGTIYLSSDTIGDLVSDIDTFVGSRSVYKKHGIPYRRGYLFEGPPGTGKSSLVLAIASKYRMPIYAPVLSKADPVELAQAMLSMQPGALVLLEDIDRFFGENKEKLGMGGLLNIIDGVGAREDRILIMTANNPKMLDSALTRSGRIDRVYHIGYPSKLELRRFYDSVSGDVSMPSWIEFYSMLPSNATIADAQSTALGYIGEGCNKSVCANVC